MGSDCTESRVMKRLIYYELKKILKTKGVPISIVIIFLCMILNGISSTGVLNRFKRDVLYDANLLNTSKYKEQLFSSFKGEVYSDTKYNEMLAEYNSLYDYNTNEGIADEKGKYGPTLSYDRDVYGAVIEQMQYFHDFQTDIADTIQNAEQIKENNGNLGKYADRYTEKKTTKIINVYSDILNAVRLKLCYVTAAYWYCFTESVGSQAVHNQLMLIFICCILSVYFTSEYENQMHDMTFTTYYGHLHMFAKKNQVVLVVCFLLTFLSCFINVCILSLYHGSMLSALAQPIQLIYNNEAFAEYCPFRLTFGTYVVLSFFMKFTAIYFVSNVVVFIAELFRSSLPSITISILAVIGLLQFTLYVSQDNLMYYEQKSSKLNAIYIWLRTYSPMSLLWPREYVNSFDVVNLFGIPVHRLSFALLFSWILIVVIICMNACLYCRRSASHEIRIVKYLKKIW